MLKALRYAQRYTVSRFVTRKPFFLAHALTQQCNCRCKICNVWRQKESTQELGTREIFRMQDEAWKLNFVAYLAFGGEPLMRPDALDILKHAQDLGFYTSLITNGTFLRSKAEEIAKTVDLTWVSLDYDSEYHDEMRGLKGSFRSTIEGIEKLRSEGGRIAINCVLSKLNMDAGRKMADLAQNLGVKLAFDPIEVLPSCNEEYGLSRKECRSLFEEVLELKKLGYPILNSYEFLQHLISRTGYSCAQPKVFVEVHANGEIAPFWCRKNNHILGDLRKQSLGELLYSAVFEDFVRETEGCHLCDNSSTADISMFYSTQNFFKDCLKPPSPVWRLIKEYLR
jgi:MoaA/NifB/PqqE/SkfB family radical SAM enzyme